MIFSSANGLNNEEDRQRLYVHMGDSNAADLSQHSLHAYLYISWHPVAYTHRRILLVIRFLYIFLQPSAKIWLDSIALFCSKLSKLLNNEVLPV